MGEIKEAGKPAPFASTFYSNPTNLFIYREENVIPYLVEQILTLIINCYLSFIVYPLPISKGQQQDQLSQLLTFPDLLIKFGQLSARYSCTSKRAG